MRDLVSLPDHPCLPGHVLLVGVNPAPPSVQAGHYYQGQLGQRTWSRLAKVGLLGEFEKGKEDLSFTAKGHGLTDLVKRPTAGEKEVTREELRLGKVNLRSLITQWQPGLILCVFRKPAEALIGKKTQPGHCGTFESVPVSGLQDHMTQRKRSRRTSRTFASCSVPWASRLALPRWCQKGGSHLRHPK
jgi:TDG/mug DNA glycosylase family protein